MSYKEKIFWGSATALVTPFKDDKIDYDALENLIEYQIKNETDAIVILGTTGEAPTISESEREEIVKFSKDKIKGRIPLRVGTGTNSTESTIRYSKSAHSLGANAILCVTPYYNKPTEKGLIEHYKTIAKNVEIPIILYNVPSRTGVNLTKNVLGELKNIENIVAVKEAGGSMVFFKELTDELGEYYSFYTGNDDLTYQSLSLDGSGVISVVSNALPRKMHDLCLFFRKGQKEKSKEIQEELSEFIKEMFYQTNPIPIKKALSILGLCSESVRLPLAPSEREKEILSLALKYGFKNIDKE